MLILTVFLTACSFGENPKKHLGEIYSIALDNLMKNDEDLNTNMKFIAIDMSNFDLLGKKDKNEILTFFKEKYKVDVMDATFEQLKEKGYYNPNTTALDGILLKIDRVDFKLNNSVLFEASKFRSGLGAVGVESTVQYKDGKWQIIEAKKTWIS